MRDDIQLVNLFLSEYRDSQGHAYHLLERPDTVERKAKAIEGVAIDEDGRLLAIEHTLIQPFAGQKADDIPFVTAFERLRLDESLRVPNRLIDVLPPAFAIPTGVNWEEVGKKVYEWFKDARHTFPDGDSWHTISNVAFELRVLVQTMDIPGTDGVVTVGRILPQDRPFIDVLRAALTARVPKLVNTPSDKHILLLEDAGVAIGFFKVIQGIDSNVEALPELKKVDEVWVVKTMGWKSAGDVFFYHVWPGGVRERFRLLDKPLSRPIVADR
jgi:hypothetical protein